MPEDMRRQVLDYVEFLLSRYHGKSRKVRDFRFDWEGGLSAFAGKYTSVELQHKASEWR
jgi:hypothetical protein